MKNQILIARHCVLVLVSCIVAQAAANEQVDKFVLAAAQGDLDLVKELLSGDVDINARSTPGVTALQAARIDGRKDVAEFLISKGADSQAELPPLEQWVDFMAGRQLGEKTSGVAVLVSKDGEVLLKKGYGNACLAHRVPVTPHTKFRIGSVTKQFAGAAILRLAENGKLSVDDTLDKFIPDFPRGDEVTIHHLMTHTSGIRSFTDKPGFMNDVTAETTVERMIDSFKNDPFDFDPGKGWHYNNSGYLLLGYIVKKISGKPFGDYLEETFFKPLEMNDTGVHDSRTVLRHEATGYSFEDGKLRKAIDWDMSRAGAAGAIYSTVEDLQRWNEAIFGGKALNEESLKAAFTPVELKEDVDGLPYGYGWVLSGDRGLDVVEHSGGLNGFLSHLVRYPQHNVTIVVLSNASPPPPGVAPAAIAREIAKFLLWESMEAREVQIADRSVDPKIYDRYVGRYDYGLAVLTVTKEDDRLFAQLGLQPKFEIFPKSETEFFWKVVEAHVTFEVNDKGEVTGAVHKQGGQTINAKKLTGQVLAKVDPAVYDAYLGQYDYGEGKAIMTVTKEGDRLLAQLTGQPKLEILPKSPTEFFWRVLNAEVTFVKDDGGKVVKAIHQQGGNTITAPKIK